ncbi:MAG: peptidoglycan DD-metalloendopeptidase family protein [Magnetospirillum sp.]|nr:peptidoglycan DD-metalloendopeptidase family protein [Magnetospirillum sp.]
MPDGDAVAADRRLKELERQLDKSRTDREEARRKARAAADETSHLRANIIAAARAAQESEEVLSELEVQLGDLRALEGDKGETLKRRAGQMTRVLTALQRLAWRPTEALMAQPQSPADTVRSAILLRAAVPRIEASARDLRAQLDLMAKLKDDIGKQKKKISLTTGRLEDEHKRLEDLYQRKIEMQSAAEAAGEAVEGRMRELAAEAEDLRDLLARLEQERQQRLLEAAAKTAAEKAARDAELAARKAAAEAEVAAQRAERERRLREEAEARAAHERELADARAAKEREKAEAKAAKERELAEAKAAKEREKAEAKANRERQEAEAKAARDRQEAEARLAQEREAAAAKAARDIELKAQAEAREREAAVQRATQAARTAELNAQADAKEKELAAQKATETAEHAAREAAAARPVSAERPFSLAQGHVPYPARGKVIARFGQTNEVGHEHKGLTIATRKQAQVIAPYDGQVVFSGPFRGYGLLLIIDHGEGYHTLLAGMSRIDAAVGQHLLAGEPVAVMGQDETTPTLYVELRRNGQPVNPQPWLTAQKNKVRG